MRLLFEGPSIETLLARVRDEHGPGARIVAADKVRSGGFGGFFTRERYAITVVVDPSATEAPAPEPAAVSLRPLDAPGTLLELADVIDAAEAAEAQVVMSTSAMPGTAQAVDASAVQRDGSTDRLRVVNPTRPRTLSTDGPEFAAVLAGWAQAADPAPVFTSAPVSTALERTPSFLPATLPRVSAAPARLDSDVSWRLDSSLSRRLLGLGLPRELVDRVAADTSSSGLRERLWPGSSPTCCPTATARVCARGRACHRRRGAGRVRACRCRRQAAKARPQPGAACRPDHPWHRCQPRPSGVRSWGRAPAQCASAAR